MRQQVQITPPIGRASGATQSPLKRVLESTGEPSPAGSKPKALVPAAHPAPPEEPRGGFKPPKVSRRSVTAMLAAAFAPAAAVATAAALPKVVETTVSVLAPPAPAALPVVAPAVGEDPDLLALGADVDAAIAAYRAAAARLAEARAVALTMWPDVPEEIVVHAKNQHGFFRGCFDLEQDIDGNDVWPRVVVSDTGRCFARPPRKVLQAEPLRARLESLRSDPDESDPDIEADVMVLIEVVEQYEAACQQARAVLANADKPCGMAVRDLANLALKACSRTPRTTAGVLIYAQLLAAYSEAGDYGSGRDTGQNGHEGMILGRGLADAVLRVAGVSA